MLTSLMASALALGLLGSLHCTLMCGPLAVAGCTAEQRVQLRSVGKYFGGRLLGHIFAGALFGQLGAHAGHHLPLPMVQRALVLVVAVLALGKGVSLLVSRRRSELVHIRRRPSRLASFWGSLVPREALALGLVTGAMPCGLLVGGWTLAAAAGHPLAGAVVMTAFSFATAPALLLALFALRPAARLIASPLGHGALWCALGLWIGARPFLEHFGHAGH